MVVGCGGISLNWGTWYKLLDFFENAIGIFFTYKSSPDWQGWWGGSEMLCTVWLSWDLPGLHLHVAGGPYWSLEA